MKTRLIQIIARYISIALLALAAWLFGESSPETVDAINNHSEVLALAIVGAAGLFSDLFLHRLQHGTVVKPPIKK